MRSSHLREEVIELADWALYRAKAWGRNQAVGVLPAEGAALTEAFNLRVLQMSVAV